MLWVVDRMTGPLVPYSGFVVLRCNPRRYHHGDWIWRAFVRAQRVVVVLVPVVTGSEGPIPWDRIGREVQLHVDGGAAGEPFRDSPLVPCDFLQAELMVLPVPPITLRKATPVQRSLWQGGES